MHQIVKDYYGKTLTHSGDLKTNACCTTERPPAYLASALGRVHDEILAKYYGCGFVAPQLLDGCNVLDLGCGTGRDVYVLAQLVGEKGHVLGVDMTDEQLEIAQAHREYHRERFGYGQSNVQFEKGYIERLGELQLQENAFDILVSNCVINLCPDKSAVLKEAFRLLKPGGELYFADVYADRRIPRELKEDPVLYGECLGGALYWNDFLHMAREAGFSDPRLVEDRPITGENAAVLEKVGHIGFFSATYRLFKIPDLEPACEDYGQAVVYQGTVPHHPNVFVLDKHHLIPTGKVFPVCGNTYRMLAETRFREHFQFIGSRETHHGIFPGCGSEMPFDRGPQESDAMQGCC